MNERLEELLVECLDAWERGAPGAVDAILAREPAHAGALRRELARLEAMGMLAPAPAATERRIGPYVLLGEVGRGAQAVLHLARHAELRRLVALKVADEPEARARLLAEGRVLGRLAHPNLPAVHEVGETQGVAFLAMEYVRGVALDAWWVRSGRGDVGACLRLFRDLALALDHAHANGVVHGDLKPEHVLVTAEGRAVVVDFGLATGLAAGAVLGAGPLGNLAYAAPERVRGDLGPVGPAADLYALGALLHGALRGWAVGARPSSMALHARLAGGAEALPRLSRREAPPELALVVAQATAWHPRDRYARCAEFAADLEAVLEYRAVRARGLPWWRRVQVWSRRHPWRATGLLACVAFAAAVRLLVTVAEGVSPRRAQELLAAAARRVEDVDRALRRTAEVQPVIRRVRSAFERRYVPAEERAELVRAEAAARGSRAEARDLRDQVLHDALVARERDPAGADRVLAALHLAEFHAARAADDAAAARVARALVMAHDSAGAHAGALRAVAGLALHVEPADARGWLFRSIREEEVVEGGADRLVPAPLAGPATALPVRSGEHVLRVVAGPEPYAPENLIVRLAGAAVADAVFVVSGAEPLRPLDRIVAVDGEPVRDLYPIDYLAPGEHRFELARGAERVVVRGSKSGLRLRALDARGLAEEGPGLGLAIRATVVADGAAREAVIPPGLRVRPTAAPLLVRAADARSLPLRASLEEGLYTLLLRAPGRCDVRLALDLRAGEQRSVHVTRPRAGAAPAGFVRVVPEVGESFWIQERETTVAEWLEFLNDPEIRARRATLPAHAFLPRRTVGDGYAPFLQPGPDGRCALPRGWYPEHPVFGIDRGDAEAYAAWRTRREGAALGLRFALPTPAEWLGAAAAGPRRSHVHGGTHDPRWCKGALSRPALDLEPGLRFPVDESPLGVFDLAGSLAEWGDGAPEDGTGRALILGGSALDSHPDEFRSDAVNGAPPDLVAMNLGFRLVAR
ncbi:MAG: SUMF1/EgtB/PvdO family nonheme iron enzyme [Planctomycetes bacterium]|nr:SUMF1/EgtB/PvdO family nonheme iron enzyme [Planctomycetota bacterium]